MTVSTTTNKVTYSGNGSTTAFAFSFPIFDEGDLVVIEKTVSSTVEVTKTITTDYTVSSAPYDSGGTVTMLVAPATGVELLIKRDLASTQGLDLAENDILPAESVEDALDRAILLVQEVEEVTGRALVVSDADTTTLTIPNAVDRANKFLAFDSAGNVNVSGGNSVDAGTVTVTSYMETVLDDVDAASAAVTLAVIPEAVMTTAGDILYRDATQAARLAKGTDGQFLVQTSSDAPGWTTLPVVDGVLAAHENLVCKRNAGTPNSQVDIDADAIIVNDGIWREKLTSVNVTVDITTSGANGLDTGAEAASTWYYLWVIFNGSTTAGLLSTSISAPTMPSGYTFKGLAGAVYNDATGSGDFDDFYQIDRQVVIENVNAVNIGSATALTDLDLTAIIPIGALMVGGYGILTPGLTATTYHMNIQPLGTGSMGLVRIGHGDANGGYNVLAPWRIMVIEDQNIHYSVSNASTQATIQVTGYEW